MRKLLFSLSTFAAFASSAMAEDRPTIRPLTSLALAGQCKLQFNTSAVLWLSAINDSLPKDEAARLSAEAKEAADKLLAEKGRLEACYEARAALYRDGML